MGQSPTPQPAALPYRQPDGKTLTVVIPLLNEEKGLDPLIARLVPVLKASGLDWSILFVDDGSKDGTMAALQRLHASEPRINAISLSRNFGKEIAVAAGLSYSQADATVVMDSDLQHPPEIITEFLARWREGNEVIYGQRMDRSSDSAWRRVGAKFFYGIFHALSGTELQPNSCDFRLLDRKALNAVNRVGERKRYNNGLFAWIGFKAIGVPFEMPARRQGDTSRWLPLKLFRFALDGVASFSTIPLRVWSVLGLIVSGLAFSYMAVVILKTLFYGDAVRGYPTLMITVLFLAGIQLISLGVIGEYLGRVYEEVKGRPLYLVREELGLKDDGAPQHATASIARDRV
ncbi:MAG: glycosyltransferase family 2 protein [Hyphomicrobium sp.]